MGLSIFPTSISGLSTAGKFGEGNSGMGKFGEGNFGAIIAADPGFPFSIDAGYRTLVSDFAYGKEQRRTKWTYPLRTLKAAWPVLTQAERADILAFYADRGGEWEAFWFIISYTDTYKDEYMGKGDGGFTFDLPSLNTDEATLIVYVSGIQTAVTFVSGTGEAGADQIQFVSPPASGAIISADVKGNLRLKARFLDPPQVSLTGHQFYSIAASMKEIR